MSSDGVLGPLQNKEKAEMGGQKVRSSSEGITGMKPRQEVQGDGEQLHSQRAGRERNVDEKELNLGKTRKTRALEKKKKETDKVEGKEKRPILVNMFQRREDEERKRAKTRPRIS